MVDKHEQLSYGTFYAECRDYNDVFYHTDDRRRRAKEEGFGRQLLKIDIWKK